MTITDLILNFRAALVAVLPMVEAIGIPWRRGEAYDEWDDLASCIYEQLVDKVASSPGASAMDVPVPLAAYDMMRREYRECATIDVQNDTLGPGRWVFHALGTEVDPFDLVEVREVGYDAMPCSEVLCTCPLAGSRFSLALPNGSRIDRVPVYDES